METCYKTVRYILQAKCDDKMSKSDEFMYQKLKISMIYSENVKLYENMKFGGRVDTMTSVDLNNADIHMELVLN